MAIRMTAAERAEYKVLDPVEKMKMTARLKRERLEAKRAAGDVPDAPARSKATQKLPKALTPADLRGKLDFLMEKYKYSPLEALIKRRMAGGKKKMDDKEALALDKFLVPYVTPTLKSVDLQQDVKMNVSVSLTSFADTTAAMLADPLAHAKQVDQSEYAEFLEGSDEDEALFETPIEA